MAVVGHVQPPAVRPQWESRAWFVERVWSRVEHIVRGGRVGGGRALCCPPVPLSDLPFLLEATGAGLCSHQPHDSVPGGLWSFLPEVTISVSPANLCLDAGQEHKLVLVVQEVVMGIPRSHPRLGR